MRIVIAILLVSYSNSLVAQANRDSVNKVSLSQEVRTTIAELRQEQQAISIGGSISEIVVGSLLMTIGSGIFAGSCFSDGDLSHGLRYGGIGMGGQGILLLIVGGVRLGSALNEREAIDERIRRLQLGVQLTQSEFTLRMGFSF